MIYLIKKCILFIKSLFKKDINDINDLIDKKLDCIIDTSKKSSELVIDEVFYVHTEPDPIRSYMPSEILEHDNVSSTIEMVDQITGKKILVDGNTSSQYLEQAEAGVFVPGIGFIGGKQPQENLPQKQERSRSNVQKQTSIDDNDGININIDTPKGSSNKQLPFHEIILTNEAYHLYVDLAGVKKGNFKLKFNNGSLIINGKRTSMIEEFKANIRGKNKKNSLVQCVNNAPDFIFGNFSFSFPFKRSIDEGSINAEFADGLLHVTLPLRANTDVEISVI